MAEATELFVVLDPKSMEQPALERAEKTALYMSEHRSLDVRLHVYCCVNHKSVAPARHDDFDQVEAETVNRVDAWVQRLVMHTRCLGIPVASEVEWDADWRAAIVRAVKRRDPSVVLKNLTQHTRLTRLVRDTADWQLLRDCPCPLMLVQPAQEYRRQKILVAIKHTDDQAYQDANARILATGKRLADEMGSAMHAVTCFEPEDRPDRQRFADQCGLARNQVSAAMGVPEKVIASVAEDVGADLLVIARVARPESSGLMGDTARKVIDEIHTDVVVLPMTQ